MTIKLNHVKMKNRKPAKPRQRPKGAPREAKPTPLERPAPAVAHDEAQTQERDLKQLWFIRRLEKEVEQSEDALDKARRASKNAKAHFDAKVEQFRAARSRRCSAWAPRHPAMDTPHPYLVLPPATIGYELPGPDDTVDCGTAVKPTEGVEIDWTSKLITVLGLGKKLTAKLTAARINSMGELRDRANTGNLAEECTMTEAERDKFGIACEAFWTEHKVGDYASEIF